jgi:hypothetical protein
MRHLRSFKPESIANEPLQIQIVDTHEALETRVSAGFAAGASQINRTLLIGFICPVKHQTLH